jgi:transposase InsO family protein
MVDPVTGWFEMSELKTKSADVVANLVETTWLTRYPWPTQIILDRGTEFMAEFARMIVEDYGIKKKPITTRNPQANAILERLHQTLGNIIRTFKVQNQDLDKDDAWTGILAASMFAIRSTVHTMLQATPTQLVFGRDAILNIKFDADWRLIQQRKQKLMGQNYVGKNAKRIPHTYKVGTRVLIKSGTTQKYGGNPYKGLYAAVQVSTNGTLRINKGAVTDIINIRNVHPYTEPVYV